jgi:hypothetical protein
MAQKPVPIHHHVVKRYSQSRGCYDEPLLPCLRKQHHDTLRDTDVYVVGFKAPIVAYPDDCDYEIERPTYGFTRGLTRPKP